MRASEALLREICAQCEAAAAVGGGGGSTDALPIKLHPDAEVARRYDFKLPENAPGKFAQFKLDAVEIHYARIEESAQPLKLLSHYARETKKKHREVGNNEGAWFDNVMNTDTPGRKLSIDVLITRPQGSAGVPAADPAAGARGAKKPQEEPLVVQILTIEMKDPSGQAAEKAEEPEKAGKAEAEAEKAEKKGP
jgi:hypothetical protein